MVSSDREKRTLHPPALAKRRGKSTFESYAPDDKTELLVRYEKNNIFNINRKKYNSLAKEASSQQQVRRPLYEHRSFFVKSEVAKDYIAKDEYTDANQTQKKAQSAQGYPQDEAERRAAQQRV